MAIPKSLIYLVFVLLETAYSMQAGMGLCTTFEDHCCTSCFLFKKYLPAFGLKISAHHDHHSYIQEHDLHLPSNF